MTVGRFMIEDVSPALGCGRLAAKAVVGELVPVSARAYREGHHALGCNVVLRGPDGADGPFTRMRPGDPGTDTWHAMIRPDAEGRWSFTVEAFDDPYLTWNDAVEKKIDAGQGAEDLANDLAKGAEILDRAMATVPEKSRSALVSAAKALRDESRPLFERVSPALDLAELLWQHPVREVVTSTQEYPLWVDRKRALFSAWYEMFPRSEAPMPAAGAKPQHGTFATATRRLRGVAAMGFDVLYLPPIHPIGRVNRKGRNNALVASLGDVGSPWAIGSAEGGHDAIHRQLGTLEDFRRFVKAAADAGLEVAMDLALQCAPDHPWVSEHPEWFTKKADGSIAYAENPPKKYQDIYPVNFDNDSDGIRAEVLRVVLHWVAQGVKIFRVDNPHTKPFDFWHWLIWEVKKQHPDVLFLAEAFTRPAVMHGLGKIGFSQSYTYFTWRTTAREMREYCEELVASADTCDPTSGPTPRTSCTRHCSAAARRCSRFGRSWRACSRHHGACTPDTSSSSMSRVLVRRSTWTTRSTSCARGTGPRRRPAAGRWRRSSRGSTRSAGRTRPCTGCATCASTTSTTRRCCASPSATRTRTTRCW